MVVTDGFGWTRRAAVGVWIGVVLAASVAPTVWAAPLSLTSSLSVSEQYDSNVSLSPTDPVEGVRTTVAPRVNLLFQEPAIQGAVRYQVTGEWYREQNTGSRWSHLAELDASLGALKRVVRGMDFRLTGSFSRARELPTASLGGQPRPGGAVLLPSTETTERRGGMTAAYAWTPRVANTLAYTFASTRYDAAELSDSVVHDATLALRVRVSPVTTLTLNPGWNATRVDPPQTALSPPADGDRRTTTRLTIGMETAAGPVMTWSGEAGGMVIGGDRTQLVLALRLQRMWRDGHVLVTGGQQTSAGGGVTRSVSVTRNLNATAARSVTANTEVSLRAGVSGNVSVSGEPSDPTTRVVTYQAGAGVSHTFFRSLTAGIDYSYSDQRSRGGGLDGRRHLVMVTVSAQAPPWRIRS